MILGAVSLTLVGLLVILAIIAVGIWIFKQFR